MTRFWNKLRSNVSGVASIETAIIFTFVMVPATLGVAEFMHYRDSVREVADSAYSASLSIAGKASDMTDAEIERAYAAFVGQSVTITMNDVCVTENDFDGEPQESHTVAAGSCGVSDDPKDKDGVVDNYEDLVIWKKITVSKAYQKLFEIAPTSASRISVSHYVRTK